MNISQLQVLVEKVAADDKLREEALKVKDKDGLKKFINDYDKSIEIDDELAQKLFEGFQNFFKSNIDDTGNLTLGDLEEVTGGVRARTYGEMIGIRSEDRDGNRITTW